MKFYSLDNPLLMGDPVAGEDSFKLYWQRPREEIYQAQIKVRAF